MTARDLIHSYHLERENIRLRALNAELVALLKKIVISHENNLEAETRTRNLSLSRSVLIEDVRAALAKAKGEK